LTAICIHAGDALPLTLPALLRARTALHAPKSLLACDDERLTYADAERRSAALARGLLALGAGKGTRVGILQPNGSAFVVAWLAATRIGAIAVPISTFSKPAELRVLLRTADVGVLLATPSYRSHDYVAVLHDAVPDLDLACAPPILVPSLPVLRHVAFDGSPASMHRGATIDALIERGSAVEHDVLLACEDAVDASDRFVVVHTSGSTGDPKGVVHTHGALIRHLDNLKQIRRYTPDEILFSNSPFFWIGGLAYSLLGTLVAGGTLVCSNASDASDVLDVLERERPTMVNGFAQSVAHLPHDPTFARRDLSSIRRGNLYPILPPDVRPADPELRHAMLGMTEAGSVCLASADESDQPEHRRGSFGAPAPGFEAAVVDPDTGATCAAGETGELWFRGPFLMEGYLGRERHEVFTADGWYRTGDFAHRDDDGFFYFHGRRGDVIKTSGANVSPREVEASILDLTGLGAHVIGLDDASRGQIVVAALRVPPGRSIDVATLRAALAARLSAYKVPRRFLVLADDEVPLLSSGKLDRSALAALFTAGAGSASEGLHDGR
jgi:acyl-CoA synthetase (AMP-forming)/AMP-acid ligase II